MVNKAELRHFLTQYFSDNELEELCFDYFPDLLNEFTAHMTKSQKAIALIGYCERRGRTDHLLTALATARAEAFARQFGLVPLKQKSDHDAGVRNRDRIFLSHANQDVEFAQQLADDLRRNGLDVWIAPDSIEPGEKWVDAINRGLETSGVFVLVMTARAAGSKWVRDEAGYAIALENKEEMRFITLDVGEGRMPPLWSVRQHISFREDYDEGLQQLLVALRPDRAAKPAVAALPHPVDEPAKEDPPLAAPKPAPRKRRAPAKTTAQPAATAAAAKTVEETNETQPAPQPAAPLSKTVDPPPPTRGPEPVTASPGASATQPPITPIREPDPTPVGQRASSSVPGKPLYWALGAVVLLAVMFIGWRLMAGDVDRNLTPTPTVTLSTAIASDIRTVNRGGVAAEQVFVPAGSFMMGNDEYGLHYEQPMHGVALDAFWIDRTEVTNGQFAACVADGACQPPSDRSSDTRSSYYGNTQYVDYPAINVTWNSARDFCEWTGGRLPTEAEWEFAARGPEAFTYPWGNEEPSCDRLNYDKYCVGDTSEVGSYPDGASWIGALDMAGNVMEWVNDWFDGVYYQNSPGENPTGPASGDYRVLRGGAWDNATGSEVRSYKRMFVLLAVNHIKNIGFRCAQD